MSRAKLWERLFGLHGIYLVSDWLQCIVWAFRLVDASRGSERVE